MYMYVFTCTCTVIDDGHEISMEETGIREHVHPCVYIHVYV